MTKDNYGRGFWVDDCPLYPGEKSYCFPSCTFWREGKCDYEKIVQEMREAQGVAGEKNTTKA